MNLLLDAQAQTEGMSIVTRDPRILEYIVPNIVA
jgi:PIN domain nuclease of toxin-antitoxin system